MSHDRIISSLSRRIKCVTAEYICDLQITLWQAINKQRESEEGRRKNKIKLEIYIVLVQFCFDYKHAMYS